jgi:hypothetical protein
VVGLWISCLCSASECSIAPMEQNASYRRNQPGRKKPRGPRARAPSAASGSGSDPLESAWWGESKSACIGMTCQAIDRGLHSKALEASI